MNILSYATAGLMLMTVASPAAADLLYKPLNPSFGGDSFNSSHLQGLAATQNEYKESASSSSQQQTSSERFLTMLQSRLYSSLAAQVSDSIFGENAQDSGTLVFDDQQISFINTGTEIQLTVTDFTTGKVTNIIVPTLQ
jgi:curli production assembly/transport component CsgF